MKLLSAMAAAQLALSGLRCPHAVLLGVDESVSSSHHLVNVEQTIYIAGAAVAGINDPVLPGAKVTSKDLPDGPKPLDAVSGGEVSSPVCMSMAVLLPMSYKSSRCGSSNTWLWQVCPEHVQRG